MLDTLNSKATVIHDTQLVVIERRLAEFVFYVLIKGYAIKAIQRKFIITREN